MIVEAGQELKGPSGRRLRHVRVLIGRHAATAAAADSIAADATAAASATTTNNTNAGCCVTGAGAGDDVATTDDDLTNKPIDAAGLPPHRRCFLPL